MGGKGRGPPPWCHDRPFVRRRETFDRSRNAFPTTCQSPPIALRDASLQESTLPVVARELQRDKKMWPRGLGSPCPELELADGRCMEGIRGEAVGVLDRPDGIEAARRPGVPGGAP